jgi:hypothetical protein
MPDDKSNRGPADRSRINIHEDYEVKYWTEKWGITAAKLREAVGAVGVMSHNVATYLGKTL